MYDLKIDGLGIQGEGIGRLADGRVVFVEHALPGDTVRIEIESEKKRVLHARLLEIISPSPERVDSRCKIARCDGCAVRGFSQQGQAELKRQRVVETLKRIGGVDVSVLLPPLIQAGEGWRYRHRIRLHATWSGRKWRLGYYERNSHNLVPLSDCPILWSELEHVALKLQHEIEKLPKEAALLEVEVAYSRRDGRAAAKLYAEGAVNIYKEWLQHLQSISHLSGIDIETKQHRLRHGNLELRYDHEGDFDLLYEPGVFTQANPTVNEALVRAVTNWVLALSPRHVLELHAGIGNFSLPLASRGISVIAVESNQRASILCGRNARAANFPIQTLHCSDAVALTRAPQADLVLLDPPRAGAKEAINAIATQGPAHVIYVSCDVATLARDSAVLCQSGFVLEEARCFDMFPQTPHVETVLYFRRRKN